MSRNAKPVNELETEAVFAVLDSPEMARATEGSEEDRGALLMAQIAEEEAQRQELAAAYAVKKITMAEWLTARAPIEQRIQGLSVEFAAASRRQTVANEYVGRGGALREDGDLLSIDQRRAINASIIDHMVIESAGRGLNKFDPSRIKPVPREGNRSVASTRPMPADSSVGRTHGWPVRPTSVSRRWSTAESVT